MCNYIKESLMPKHTVKERKKRNTIKIVNPKGGGKSRGMFKKKK